MNITRLNEMADLLDGLPNANRDYRHGEDAMDMHVWRCSVRSDPWKKGCGSVGCIAGQTVMHYDGTRKRPAKGWGARAAFLFGFCAEDDYSSGPGLRAPTTNAETERRVAVAAALFHPVPSPVVNIFTIDGTQCATVLRGIADTDTDTITADDVQALWIEATMQA